MQKIASNDAKKTITFCISFIKRRKNNILAKKMTQKLSHQFQRSENMFK